MSPFEVFVLGMVAWLGFLAGRYVIGPVLVMLVIGIAVLAFKAGAYVLKGIARVIQNVS